jgi:hypothetical protein
MSTSRRSVPIDRVLHVLSEYGVEIVHEYRPGVIRLHRPSLSTGACGVMMVRRDLISPIVLDHISGLLRIDPQEAWGADWSA